MKTELLAICHCLVNAIKENGYSTPDMDSQLFDMLGEFEKDIDTKIATYFEVQLTDRNKAVSSLKEIMAIIAIN